MKGLLTKDFCLFFQRKRTFIFLAVWAVVMTVTMDGSFAMGWMTIIASFFSISSLTYDEYDNCYPFLMSMPVSGKIYALEKYLFGFICGMGAWLFSAVVYVAVALAKGNLTNPGTELIQMAIFIPVFMVLISVSLPLNFKLGSERGRIAILIIWGVVFVGIYAVTKFFKVSIKIDQSSINGPLLISGAFIGAALLTAASMAFSVNVMKNKEF